MTDKSNSLDEKSSLPALEAEEARLREIIRQKRQRSNPEERISSTPAPVHCTGVASTTRGFTSSHVSEEAKDRSPPSPIDQSLQQAGKAIKNLQLPGNTGTSQSQSESRSLESVAFSRSSASSRSQDQANWTARGRTRKRERRRMNREARRRGDPMLGDNLGGNYPRHSGGGAGAGRGPPPPPPHFSRGGPDAPGRWERGGRPPPREWRGPPADRRGPPPLPPRGEYDYSGFRSRSRSRSPRNNHRGRRWRSRSRSGSSESSHRMDSRSASRSRSRSLRRDGGGSRSRSRSVHNSSGRDRGNGEHRLSGSGRRSGSGRGDDSRGSRGSSSHKKRHRSRSPSTSSSSGSSSSSDDEPVEKEDDSVFSKDQRTVFVSQLVMRTTEKDIRRYFKRKVGCHVKEVILLRDKRTGNHKGCAYVQLGRIEDVNKAIGVAGQPPDFQRFPILVKPSEAEKNYVINASSSTITASMMGTVTSSKPLIGSDGRMIEAQKVYVGGLDASVTEGHIFALFSQFGQLEKVTMQMDPTTKTSRGYAFLSYRDPKEANLAIQTLSDQVLAGRPLKTGWASQTSTVQGVDIVTSDEFPEDATLRAKKALSVLAQMSGGSDASVSNSAISVTAERALDAAMAGVPVVKPVASSVPTVAEARANLTATSQPGATEHLSAPGVAAAPLAGLKIIGGSEIPTNNVLVHNMFDKDQETGADWPAEIKEEFEEECSKFGKIKSVTVMSTEPGGKIYAIFETVDAAVKCANNLAGRWFDKRQLRVDFMLDSEMPESSA